MPPHERMFRHEHAEKLDDVERHRWLPPDDVIGRLAVQAGMRVEVTPDAADETLAGQIQADDPPHDPTPKPTPAK